MRPAGMHDVFPVGGWAKGGELEKLEFAQASMEDLVDFVGEGAAGTARDVLVDPRVNRDVSITMTLHKVTKGIAFAYAAELGEIARAHF